MLYSKVIFNNGKCYCCIAFDVFAYNSHHIGLTQWAESSRSQSMCMWSAYTYNKKSRVKRHFRCLKHIMNITTTTKQSKMSDFAPGAAPGEPLWVYVITSYHRTTFVWSMGKHDVIHKSRSKYVLHCHRNGTEPRPHLICTENYVKFGRAVLEIYNRTDIDIQTCRPAHRNTSHHYCRRRNNKTMNNTNK